MIEASRVVSKGNGASNLPPIPYGEMPRTLRSAKAPLSATFPFGAFLRVRGTELMFDAGGLRRQSWRLMTITTRAFGVSSAALSLLLVQPALQGQAPSVPAAPAATVESANPAALEAMGYAMARQLGLQVGFSDEELDQVFVGMRRLAKGENEPEGFEEAVREAMNIYRVRTEAYRAIEEARKAEIAKGKEAEAEKFFAEIEQTAGVLKSESGLRYQIIEAGDASKKASANDQVKVHYHGTLIDGTVFDSSRDRGEPATFSVRGVVPGFSEGLQLIGQGGKIKLYIPANLGYGNNPRPGGAIEPGDTLIFEVEVLEVIPGRPQPPRPAQMGARPGSMPPGPPPGPPPSLPPNLPPPPPPPSNMRPPSPPPPPPSQKP